MPLWRNSCSYEFLRETISVELCQTASGPCQTANVVPAAPGATRMRMNEDLLVASRLPVDLISHLEGVFLRKKTTS